MAVCCRTLVENCLDPWRNYEPISDEIRSLLDMIKNPIKVDVARSKILKYHFCGEKTSIHELMCIHETVLPYAIEWIGSDEHGYSAMFEFVKSFPALFNTAEKEET